MQEWDENNWPDSLIIGVTNSTVYLTGKLLSVNKIDVNHFC